MSYGMDAASKYWRDKHVEQLEKENAELRNLIEDIFNSIPETYLTGYGWDDDFKVITKEKGR